MGRPALHAAAVAEAAAFEAPEHEEVLGSEDLLAAEPAEMPPASGVRMSQLAGADETAPEAPGTDNLSYKVYTFNVHARSSRGHARSSHRLAPARPSQADMTFSCTLLRAAIEALSWKKIAIRTGIVVGTLLTLLFVTLTVAELMDDQKAAGSAAHVASAQTNIPIRTALAARAPAVASSPVVIAPAAVSEPAQDAQATTARTAAQPEVDVFDALESPPPVKRAKKAKKAAKKAKASRLAIRTAPF
jgi:hypothetical protein